MNIVGINGFKRSGKNTVYELAQQMLPNAKVQQIGFADALKCIGLEALGFDRPDDELILLADSIKEASTISVFYEEPDDQPVGQYEDMATLHNETGREFFQNLGNLARERFGKDFWVDQVLPVRWVDEQYLDTTFSRLELAKDYDTDYLFITDLRYPNEADRIKALGGVVWEVIRPGIESDGHASEQPLPRELVDWVIHNDGSLDDLRLHVHDAIEETLT